MMIYIVHLNLFTVRFEIVVVILHIHVTFCSIDKYNNFTSRGSIMNNKNHPVHFQKNVSGRNFGEAVLTHIASFGTALCSSIPGGHINMSDICRLRQFP